MRRIDMIVSVAVLGVFFLLGCDNTNSTFSETPAMPAINEAQHSTADPFWQPYHIIVFTEPSPGDERFEESFEDDTGWAIGPSDARSDVVAYINDSPFIWCPAGSILKGCEFLLQPGQNEVRLEGPHEGRMYVKVMTLLPDLRVEEVVAKELYPVGQESLTLTFQVHQPLEYPVPFDVLLEGYRSPDDLEKDLRVLADRLHDACRKRDVEAIANILCPDPSLPLVGLYEPGKEDVRPEFVDEYRDIIASLDAQMPATSDEIRICIGDRSAIMYSGLDDGGPYVIRFASHETALRIQPQLVFRVNGKWVLASTL